MIHAGLILEGGGMRGIYTAGVLDFFMDQGLVFSDLYGVSAGACHLCSYLSGQRGRAFRIGVDYLRDRRYCGAYSLLTTGDLFGAKMCYDLIPNELDPYDYEKADRYPGRAFAVVTNCETGQAEYLPLEDLRRDIQAVRASSSMPLVSRMVRIGGAAYLDGGIADSIPLAASLERGQAKHVVVLTQAPGYEKKPNSLMPLMRARYRKYPRLLKTIEDRHQVYNESLSLVRTEQMAGRAFVLQPARTPEITRVEKDREKLRALYDQGYADAEARREELMAFLGQPRPTPAESAG